LNFPFYIAKRYIRSKSSQNAVNIINFITFLVIVIGSAALFIVLSGFAGLKTFSLSFSDTFDPDLKAVPAYGKFFSLSNEQERALGTIPGVLAFSKELEEQVLLTHKEKLATAFVKGIDSTYTQATQVDSTLYYGTWTIDRQQGVVGIGIINQLGVTVNQFSDPLEIIAFKPGKGGISQSRPENLYNALPFLISGAYSIEENLDKKYVFADLRMAQALFEKDSTQISGINFRLDPQTDVAAIRQELTDVLGTGILLKNRQQLNSTLHRMLNTENLATYLIFTLVLIIALFNVVGAIIMMILDKQQNSKTLFSLGTTLPQLRNIYFVQGVIVTTAGGFIGVLLGSLLIWSQLFFGWLKITPSLAYPVEYNLMNVLVVLATIMVLGIIASKIASSRITKKLVSP